MKLADHRLAPQPAAALRVPLAEHRGRRLQQIQLRLGQPRGPAGAVRLLGAALALARGHRDQPALHRLDEAGSGGEREGGAEEAAARQHQVTARELADEGDRLGAGPGQVHAGDGRGLVGGAQAQLLDADHAAEALGEQLGQDPRNGLARLLAVEPAAHPGGVRTDVVGAHLTGPAVDLARQLPLGPAAAHEPRTQLCVGLFGGVGAATAAVAAHWKPPSR